ncbi:hypothetical protein ABHF33_16435 [Chitinibacter sp. FCG-7]|uniref:SMODS and SLOG-associating 2TM effector domain-containing protein n=1 Tax=Chitinibacter mangrovi TaxID=3153927 RepID=A0AAU7F9M0_9NEIS
MPKAHKTITIFEIKSSQKDISNKMHNELLQKQYDFELEQRNSIASAINIPIVAVTVVSSAASIISIDYQYNSSIKTYIFLFFITLTAIFIARSVFFTFKSFLDYEYKKLPNSASLLLYRADLLEWHTKNPTSNSTATAEESTNFDFSNYLNNLLADAADWNSQNNIIRGNYLHRSTAAVAISILMLAPSGLLYIHNKATSEEKTYQVQLIQPTNQSAKEKNVSNNSNNSNTNTPTTAPLQAPIPSTKPTGPSNVIFKGNTDIPKPSATNNLEKK